MPDPPPVLGGGPLLARRFPPPADRVRPAERRDGKAPRINKK